MPFTAIVVGAGIAGLCAAVSLRQAGHSVQIFEKSAFATETGAALVLSPNGARVLASLGFSFDRARACRMDCWENCDGASMTQVSCTDFKDSTSRFGAHVWTIHRVDLHTELLRLALDGEGAAVLHLNATVTDVQLESGTIHLQDGSIHHADIVVAADGLHSVTRRLVTKNCGQPEPSGMSAFRFLLDTDLVQRELADRSILSRKRKGISIFADLQNTHEERHMVWYCCRGGDVQNFVGIHPTRPEATYGSVDEKAAMAQEFAHFHPDLRHAISLAEDVKCWPLFIHRPLKSWVYGKVVLIGDAAHPMLPFGGQGSNQAIEDGGALGYLLGYNCRLEDIPERLSLFESIRCPRAARVQVLSKVRSGREQEVQTELSQYGDESVPLPKTFSERIDHDYGFDVMAKCAEALASAPTNHTRSIYRSWYGAFLISGLKILLNNILSLGSILSVSSVNIFHSKNA